MSTPHKWAEVIKAWADGKAIEFRAHGGEWRLFYLSHRTPGFSNDGLEWRVRPPKPMYRVALMRESGRHRTATADNDGEAVTLEHSLLFMRWLTDWTEYDV